MYLANEKMTLLCDGSPFGAAVLQQLKFLEVASIQLIYENRRKNIAQRLCYRSGKYGLGAALTWAFDSFFSQAPFEQLPLQAQTQVTETRVPGINDEQALTALSSYQPTIILTTISTILKSRILAIPQRGVFGFHPGLLPKYLGLSPIHWQIYDGQTPGFSIFRLTDKMDEGPTYYQQIVKPFKNEAFHQYCIRFHLIGARALSDCAVALCSGRQIEPINPAGQGMLNRGLMPFSARIRMEKQWHILTDQAAPSP